LYRDRYNAAAQGETPKVFRFLVVIEIGFRSIGPHQSDILVLPKIKHGRRGKRRAASCSRFNSPSHKV
jgi:hypothetical protein